MYSLPSQNKGSAVRAACLKLEHTQPPNACVGVQEAGQGA